MLRSKSTLFSMNLEKQSVTVKGENSFIPFIRLSIIRNSGLLIKISNERDHDHVESALDERAQAHAECALGELFLGDVLQEFGLDEHGHHFHEFQNQDVEPLQRNVKKLEIILPFLTADF